MRFNLHNYSKLTTFFLSLIFAAVFSGQVLGFPGDADRLASKFPRVLNLYAQDGKQRGVSWVAGRKISPEDLKPLVRDNIEWIVQTPFGWQRNYDSPQVILATPNQVFWGESDEGLTVTTQMAHRLGIKTMLKPHIWLHRNGSGKWRGEIEMKSEADWERWFASYGKFILHYAKLAEKLNIEALCIGTELHLPAVRREADWRRLIEHIRRVYHGKILYAANWYREFEEINFWDALDYIGIQAYFPLTKNRDPTVEEIKKGWQPYLKAIEKVQKKFQKPVIFTEIGYKSTDDSAIEPWKWPREMEWSKIRISPQTQANCFEAFFQTFWRREWFAGAYFWKWFPHNPQANRHYRYSFTPQFKPAEKVIAKWYRQPVSPGHSPLIQGK